MYWKVRQTLASLLGARGYDTTVLSQESPLEVHAMQTTDTLDFQLEPNGGTIGARGIVYVHFEEGIRTLNYTGVDKIVGAYELNPADTLLIVSINPPSSRFVDALHALWKTRSLFVQCFTLSELAVDKTQNLLVPPHRVLKGDEKTEFLKRWTLESLPLLGREDAIAKWIGARPDDVVEILRTSPVVGFSPYWRLVVNEL